MTSVDMKAFVKKQPVGFACGLLSLILALQLYFQSGRIEVNQSDYETKSAEAAKIISNVSTSKNLAAQVQEIQANVKEMESRLVHAGQLAVNLQYVYKLEAETEVKVLDVRQNGAPKGVGYGAVPFSVSIQGSYKQIMVFVNRLENGRYFCRISNAVFGKVTGSDKTQELMTLTLNFELFGQP